VTITQSKDEKAGFPLSCLQKIPGLSGTPKTFSSNV